MNDIITQHEFIAIIKIIQIERKEIEQKKENMLLQHNYPAHLITI